MNYTSNSVRSGSSQDGLSRQSFRVIVKNRITHQNVEPSHEKSQIINVRKSVENFDQAKKNMKKYIRSMKASSKVGNYDSKQNTNRSVKSYHEKQSKMVLSGRADLSSRKNNSNKAFASTFLKPVQNRCSIRESIEDSSKNQQQVNRYAKQEINPIVHEAKGKYRSVNESRQQEITSKLPILRSALEHYEQHQDNALYSNGQNKRNTETSSRQRLGELQLKIEFLLAQKLKIISSADAFGSNELQNRTAFKLLEKQMDRILFQIRRIKENDSTMSINTIEHGLINKDIEINRNIEVLERKVKILERLIGQKLFQADNLKNQYLMKMKQHKRNNSERPNKYSQSSKFYREANRLQTSSFKPSKYQKGAIFSEDPTTNKADFKKPLKSYYISPSKSPSYNSNTLTQPLPRSTYNCQYLMYGALPNQLIQVGSAQKDSEIFNSGMSAGKQKHMLEGSTYKEDFVSVRDSDRVNFRELDAYRDKFKSIQVNYGKERNNQKINNSHSVMEYYEDAKSANKEGNNGRVHTENPEMGLPLLKGSSSKKLNIRVKLEEMSRSMMQTLNQTEKRMSMLEQQSLQKNHSFHQRIKSQIKHKNVYDQKYKFKSELIKQKIKKYVEGSALNEKMRAHQTMAY